MIGLLNLAEAVAERVCLTVELADVVAGGGISRSAWPRVVLREVRRSVGRDGRDSSSLSITLLNGLRMFRAGSVSTRSSRVKL